MGRVSSEARNEMEDIMASWKERGRVGAPTNLDGTPTATGTSGDGDGQLPLGPGEWSEPLGLPLCVVCQNVTCVYSAFTHTVLTSRRPKKWNF